MKREIIHYYLSAIEEKFTTHRLHIDEDTTYSPNIVIRHVEIVSLRLVIEFTLL